MFHLLHMGGWTAKYLDFSKTDGALFLTKSLSLTLFSGVGMLCRVIWMIPPTGTLIFRLLPSDLMLNYNNVIEAVFNRSRIGSWTWKNTDLTFHLLLDCFEVNVYLDFIKTGALFLSESLSSTLLFWRGRRVSILWTAKSSSLTLSGVGAWPTLWMTWVVWEDFPSDLVMVLVIFKVGFFFFGC